MSSQIALSNSNRLVCFVVEEVIMRKLFLICIVVTLFCVAYTKQDEDEDKQDSLNESDEDNDISAENPTNRWFWPGFGRPTLWIPLPGIWRPRPPRPATGTTPGSSGIGGTDTTPPSGTEATTSSGGESTTGGTEATTVAGTTAGTTGGTTGGTTAAR